MSKKFPTRDFLNALSGVQYMGQYMGQDFPGDLPRTNFFSRLRGGRLNIANVYITHARRHKTVVCCIDYREGKQRLHILNLLATCSYI